MDKVVLIRTYVSLNPLVICAIFRDLLLASLRQEAKKKKKKPEMKYCHFSSFSLFSATPMKLLNHQVK
jgi:hypothetical protein